MMSAPHSYWSSSAPTVAGKGWMEGDVLPVPALDVTWVAISQLFHYLKQTIVDGLTGGGGGGGRGGRERRGHFRGEEGEVLEGQKVASSDGLMASSSSSSSRQMAANLARREAENMHAWERRTTTAAAALTARCGKKSRWAVSSSWGRKRGKKGLVGHLS